MPLLVPVIRITDIRPPFASREAAKRLLGGAVGGEEALDPELAQRDVVGCSEEVQVTGRDLGLHGQVELAPPSRPPIYADAVRPPMNSEVIDSPTEQAENASMHRDAYDGSLADKFRWVAP